jgi:hypothetical protein
MPGKQSPNINKTEKRVTRYTYEHVRPRTPTPLLPADEQVVTLPMDNGWSRALVVGKLPDGDERPVVVDMDPTADPVLFWAGKRGWKSTCSRGLIQENRASSNRIFGPATGPKARKSVSEHLRYKHEPLGRLRIIPDFLPGPEGLTPPDEGVKVTIALSKRSVEFFKNEARQRKRHINA